MGKFIVNKTPKGFTFHLKASNGETIATSEVYSTLASCKKGIESVVKNSKSRIEDQTIDGFDKILNPKFEIFADKNKEYRFRLRAKNGEQIAASEGYKTKTGCKNGIESIGKNAADFTVIYIADAKR